MILTSVGVHLKIFIGFAKVYIFLQKEYTYTRNQDKLFSKAEFFTFVYVIIFYPLVLVTILGYNLLHFTLTVNIAFLKIERICMAILLIITRK